MAGADSLYMEVTAITLLDIFIVLTFWGMFIWFLILMDKNKPWRDN